MTARQKRIRTQCEDCSGTGLYCGMCEPKGTAVVCLRCDGTGCHVLTYLPFKGRKPRRGIRSVRQSRGTFLATGVGAVGKGISYAAFCKAKKYKAKKR